MNQTWSSINLSDVLKGKYFVRLGVCVSYSFFPNIKSFHVCVETVSGTKDQVSQVNWCIATHAYDEGYIELAGSASLELDKINGIREVEFSSCDSRLILLWTLPPGSARIPQLAFWVLKSIHFKVRRLRNSALDYLLKSMKNTSKVLGSLSENSVG